MVLKLLWFTKFHSERWELENSVGPDVTRQERTPRAAKKKKKTMERESMVLLSSKDYAIIICFLSLSLFEKGEDRERIPLIFYSKT